MRESSVFMRVQENRTAIHLQPFLRLCQSDFFGFHRFFPVFSGFYPILALFETFTAIPERKSSSL